MDAIVEEHHEALSLWTEAVRKGAIDTPQWILHVDQHHDMLGERHPICFGNFFYFAMRRWPKCRVRWLAESRIDSPEMWLSEHAWESVCARFAYRAHWCRTWPKPDMVTVCTSPGFVDEILTTCEPSVPDHYAGGWSGGAPQMRATHAEIVQPVLQTDSGTS